MENHRFSLNSTDGDFYQAYGEQRSQRRSCSINSGDDLSSKEFDSKGELLGLNQKNMAVMNTFTPYSLQPQELDSLTKLYLGGLTIVGLFVLFKCLD